MHKTEYSGHSLWNMTAGGGSSELNPAKKLQVQSGNLVPLWERGRATRHPPKSLFTSQHSHRQPTPSQHPSEAESCLYPYTYPSLSLKPCAPHQTNWGERAGAFDPSSGANVMSFSQAFCWHLPTRRCHHSPAPWCLEPSKPLLPWAHVRGPLLPAQPHGIDVPMWRAPYHTPLLGIFLLASQFLAIFCLSVWSPEDDPPDGQTKAQTGLTGNTVKTCMFLSGWLQTCLSWKLPDILKLV